MKSNESDSEARKRRIAERMKENSAFQTFLNNNTYSKEALKDQPTKCEVDAEFEKSKKKVERFLATRIK